MKKRELMALLDELASDGEGWTEPKLERLGVPWPPPKGWMKALQRGKPIPGTVKKDKSDITPKMIDAGYRAIGATGWDVGEDDMKAIYVAMRDASLTERQ